MDEEIREEFTKLTKNVSNLLQNMDNHFLEEIGKLKVGQNKMQLCIDGLTDKISNIEHQLTHFVK